MEFLQTQRLTLRTVEEKDTDEMFDYRNHTQCARYQRGQTKDYAGICELARKRKNDILGVDAPCLLAVAQRDTDKLIGEIVVMPNEGTISLGYTFSYKIHRRGYAFEALSALLEWLHSRYPEWDYVCFTDPENIPSRLLLEKLGYADMGYLPGKASQVYGKWLRPDSIAEITAAVAD